MQASIMAIQQKWIMRRIGIHVAALAVLMLASVPLASAEAPESAPAYASDVSVSRFDASVAPDDKVWLDWRTDVALGAGFFRIERESPDGAWSLVGEGYVPMRGEEEGEGGDTYRLHDPAAREGQTVRYRLTFLTRGGGEREAASWQGRLAHATVVSREVVKSVAADAPVPLVPPSEPQAWIGNGPRVRPWNGSQSADRVRLSLRTTGIYRVTATELSASSGWDEAYVRQAIAATNLALSCQGRPVAWLADGDALLFHGEPATTDTAPENVYWVAPGPGTGMAVATAAFPAEPATNACFAESRFFQGTNHLTRVSYNSRTDLPFVAYGLRSNTSADKSLTSIEPVDDPAPGAWTGTVSVTFLSYYENSEVDEHAVEVSVGGGPVRRFTWSGERLLTHVFSLPSSALDGAAAAVTVRHVAPPPPLMTTDYTRFVWLSCELAYPRAYRARGGALLCRGGGGNLSAVSGFPSNDVVVLDVTVPRAPVVIAPVALAWEGREAGWTAAFPSGGADQAYQVFSRSAGIRRPSVRGVRDLDWDAFAGVAHVILIPPEGWCGGFREAVQPLADFRTAEGLRSVVVDVELLYDKFSCGLVDPLAIQAFCRRLQPRGLRYLLLAGAGALDFRHQRLSVDDYTACLIPTRLAGQRFPLTGEDMVAAVDGELADVNLDHVPDLAVGRLPTTRPQEVATSVQKTLAFERARRWREMAAVTADWDCTGIKNKEYAFSDGTDKLVGPLSADGRTVRTFYTSDPKGSLAAVRLNYLLPAMRAGAALFHFFGHANELRLGYRSGYDSLLSNTDITPAKWPKPVIAVFICCLPNRWQSPYTSTPDVLLPYGLLANGTGFVAGIGSTGYLVDTDGEAMGIQFYSGGGKGTRRLGDLWLRGLRNLAGAIPQERLLSVSLVGDPALCFDLIHDPGTAIIIR